jgi:ubiquinone/menaquinone biosynthesis C-methylase UbiE
VDDPILGTRDTYDAVAARYLENARDRSGIAPHLDAFVRELRAGALVVDVGAGPGMDRVDLARRGVRAIALDFSRGMLRTGAAEYPGPRVQGDARRLPIASGTADGVWAKASLLHLPADDARAALREVRRVLRTDGILWLSVKRGSGADTESDRYGKPRFFQYWSADGLDAALDACGFDTVAESTDLGPLNVWLTRLARRR